VLQWGEGLDHGRLLDEEKMEPSRRRGRRSGARAQGGEILKHEIRSTKYEIRNKY
jgi:hypothetical protein